ALRALYTQWDPIICRSGPRLSADLQVVKEEPAWESSMEIVLVGGRVLKLPASISADRLAEVVHALEAIAVDRQRSSDVRGVR
ncbi:hypothetical protein K2Y11_10740, partial [bacterium]|nr:hypothetical protein [bacterium]